MSDAPDLEHETPMEMAMRVKALIGPIIDAEIESGRDSIDFSAQIIACILGGIHIALGTAAALQVLDQMRDAVLDWAEECEATRRAGLQ